MKRGVRGRPKPSSDAEQQYRDDVAYAARRADLLDAAGEAESQFRKGQARRAPVQEMRRLADDLDAALTEAMRSAYAARRAAIGPRGYDDRIYRRKAMATPPCTRSPHKPSTCSRCGKPTASTASRPYRSRSARPRPPRPTSDVSHPHA